MMPDDLTEDGLLGLIATTVARFARSLPSPLATRHAVIMGPAWTGWLRLEVFAAGEVLASRNEEWGGDISLAVVAGYLPTILREMGDEAGAGLRARRAIAGAAARFGPEFSSN